MSEPLQYESRLNPSEPPGSLRAVAWVFIAFGILAVIDVVTDLAEARINLNFGVLGIFIGRGLLRYSQGWRTCGLVFTWIGMIGSALLGLVAILGGANITLAGQRFTGPGPRILGIAICAALFTLALWQYRTLTRPDVRRLFGLRDRPG